MRTLIGRALFEECIDARPGDGFGSTSSTETHNSLSGFAGVTRAPNAIFLRPVAVARVEACLGPTCQRIRLFWEESAMRACVVTAIAKDVGRVCRRYVPHALLVLAACVVSWVLSECYV